MTAKTHDKAEGPFGLHTVKVARVRFRRAISLIVMTLVVPGSAQLVCGNRRVGRWAVRGWIGIWVVLLGLVVLSLFSRRSIFAIFTNVHILSIGRIALIIAAILWIGLLLDAMRLGLPRRLRRGHRLSLTILNTVLCVGIAAVMVFAAHLVSVQKNFIDSVFVSHTVSEPSDGRYNVLLMGADSGPGRSGWRPDSLTVVSVDQDSGKAVLIGIPRNLQNVPFPKGSAMHAQWPNGFNCDDCEINAINTWVHENANTLGQHKTSSSAQNDPDDHDDTGARNSGAKATAQAVEQVTGLKINYRISVNMAGFSKLIDAVGGVTVNVRERTAIGGIGSPIRGYIPSGKQHLDGSKALWYARSRVQSDDWTRMGRQKCLMHAMLRQLSPKTVLTRAQKIAESSSELLSTTIPRQDLDVFLDLALKAKDHKVSVVSLVPPKVNTAEPDFDAIRTMVSDSIARSEGKTPNEGGVKAASLAELTAPTAEDLAKDPRHAGNTDDLNSSC